MSNVSENAEARPAYPVCFCNAFVHLKYLLPTLWSSTDDCCEMCLVAPGEGFALVPCGHARFCESCTLCVADLDSVFTARCHYSDTDKNISN